MSHVDGGTGARLTHLRAAAARHAWLVALVLSAALAYLLVWQRGAYWDDYTWARFQGSPPFEPRILRTLVDIGFAKLQETQEPVVRATQALAAFASALLLGWLTRRMLGSPVAGIVSAWLFVVPLFAFEAALWTSALGYLLGTSLALLCLHALWSALEHPARAILWLAAATVAYVAAALMYEVFAAVAGLVLLVGLVHASRQPSRRAAWDSFSRAAALSALLIALTGLAYLVLYQRSDMVQFKGGLDTDPASVLARAVRFTGALYRTTIGEGAVSRWGEAFELGLATLRASWGGAALALAATATVVAAASARPVQGHVAAPPVRTVVLVVALGVVWLAATLVFPSALVRDQGLASRLVYFPLAGAALVLGALAAMVARGRWALLAERAVLALGGAAMLFCAVAMVGYAEVYAARSALDRQQVGALVEALPASALPSDTHFVPILLQERPFGRSEGLSGSTTALFEVRDVAETVLRDAYGRRNLRVVTTDRRSLLHFEYRGGVDPRQRRLSIQDEPVPLDRTVPFTYRDGRVLLVETLEIRPPDVSSYTIEFPLVRQLGQDGAPTLDNLSLKTR